MSQLFTLLGVVLGAAATYSVTALNERTRWRRAQEARWDDRRVNSYIDYANAVKNCVHVSSRMVAFRGLPAGGQPLDPETGLAQLAEAEHERSVKWESIQLLGSNSVIEAGRAWHQVAWRLEKIARGGPADDHDVVAVFTAHNEARGEFFRCARADLGLREHKISVPVATGP
ncbi:hypothetical protein [Actinophytocola algeriensis]|uniref:Secreted protein n=1 Tax=Actinophytocola algeriensis TaxID=1768010 RepID=A0A7W7Q9X2_9PSEU|nr:hypothetical protein [Actinophytocola algeriensis]MBB4909741.1 hypothetical protein [Actinophytocola algeriensis]MBE1475731.1 hypothetical protein [Actinophytocola algeriensis]